MKKNRKIHIIEECQLLEQALSKYKLWGNLIPRGSFYANLRKVLTKTQWDFLREFVYKRDSYKCFICGTSGVRLEAHEHWKYDYHHSTQRLHDINALCRMCHLNNHLGLAKILMKEGKLNLQELIEHWCNVNGEKKENFTSYQEKVFRLWELRNQFEWKIVDKNEKDIFDGLNLDELVKSLK